MLTHMVLDFFLLRDPFVPLALGILHAGGRQRRLSRARGAHREERQQLFQIRTLAGRTRGCLSAAHERLELVSTASTAIFVDGHSDE